MKTITVETIQRREIKDITPIVQDVLGKDFSGVCILFLSHTSAAITTADLDPGTDRDMLDAFESMVPKFNYRHPHDPSHVPDHILSSLIGASLSIPARDGRLELGTWQRVVLVECDGPRKRTLVVTFISEGA